MRLTMVGKSGYSTDIIILAATFTRLNTNINYIHFTTLLTRTKFHTKHELNYPIHSKNLPCL